MSLIITLLVGALIGWLASMLMKTDAQQGALMNIVVGVVGSLLGRFLFGSVLGIESAKFAGDFTIAGLAWGVLGAVVFIAILKAVRR